MLAVYLNVSSKVVKLDPYNRFPLVIYNMAAAQVTQRKRTQNLVLCGMLLSLFNSLNNYLNSYL